jgi:hypothetical protein
MKIFLENFLGSDRGQPVDEKKKCRKKMIFCQLCTMIS